VTVGNLSPEGLVPCRVGRSSEISGPLPPTACGLATVSFDELLAALVPVLN
jgi:hypothetical protein